MEQIKPGSLVMINKSESIIDGATTKIFGWHEDKPNNDVNAKLFDTNTVGMYVGIWGGPLAEQNSLVWNEVMIGSKLYLFTREQLEPICHTSILEDNLLISVS
jgi:hypothetical protein